MSGAIDVVAVRHDDESFSCSPFHVKLPVRAKTKGHKTVSLLVNGLPVKVSMRLGSAGEAFFIVKNHLSSSQPPPPLPKSGMNEGSNHNRITGMGSAEIVSDINITNKAPQFR